jgi:hypothetical protein
MRRSIVLLVGILMAVALALPASAGPGGPCNDHEGSVSGKSYATHHITEVAKARGMGNEGHKPGSHQGFSVCLDVH